MTTKSVSRRNALAAAPAALLTAAGVAAQPQRQPAMQNALRALRSAEQALKNATEDKGGHRTRAIKLVNDAIDEVEKGIRFDNRR